MSAREGGAFLPVEKVGVPQQVEGGEGVAAGQGREDQAHPRLQNTGYIYYLLLGILDSRYFVGVGFQQKTVRLYFGQGRQRSNEVLSLDLRLF